VWMMVRMACNGVVRGSMCGARDNTHGRVNKNNVV
jgi:hypothetical protein